MSESPRRTVLLSSSSHTHTHRQRLPLASLLPPSIIFSQPHRSFCLFFPPPLLLYSFSPPSSCASDVTLAQRPTSCDDRFVFAQPPELTKRRQPWTKQHCSMEYSKVHMLISISWRRSTPFLFTSIPVTIVAWGTPFSICCFIFGLSLFQRLDSFHLSFLWHQTEHLCV